MQFTAKYIDQVASDVKSKDAGDVSLFSFDLDGFGMPPVIETAKVLGEIGKVGSLTGVSDLTRERVMRYAILGKLTKVSYNGKEIGSFVMNKFEDVLDNFPVLRENPGAVLILENVAMAHLLQKSMPPRIGGQATAAGTSGPQGSPKGK
jgi:hypothetical protein